MTNACIILDCENICFLQEKEFSFGYGDLCVWLWLWAYQGCFWICIVLLLHLGFRFVFIFGTSANWRSALHQIYFILTLTLQNNPSDMCFKHTSIYKPSLCYSEQRHANPQSHHTLKNMSAFKIKWLTSTSPKTTVQDLASRVHRGIIEQNRITMWSSNNISEYNLAWVLQSNPA